MTSTSAIQTDASQGSARRSSGGSAGAASADALALPVWTHALTVKATERVPAARIDPAVMAFLARETDAPVARLAPGVFAIASTPENPAPVERLARRVGSEVVGSETAVTVRSLRVRAGTEPLSDTAAQAPGELAPGRFVSEMRAALAEAREVTRRLALDAGACVAAAGRSATALEIRCDEAVRRVTDAIEDARHLRPAGSVPTLDIVRLERATAELLDAAAERSATADEISAIVAGAVREEVQRALSSTTSQITDAIRSALSERSMATPDQRLDDVHAALRTLAAALGGRLDADARDREAVSSLARDVRTLIGVLGRTGH